MVRSYATVWTGLMAFILMAGVSCMPSATSLQHGGAFSNIRSEVFLTDGSVRMGYASFNQGAGDRQIRFRLPGDREDQSIPLAAVERIKMEDHDYLVMMLLTPDAAVREGKPVQTRAVVKRMGMENDPIQVFEYKYTVRHPKSPLPRTLTAYYVSFAGNTEKPLCALNSACFRQQWASHDLTRAVKENPPASLKSLMERVKELKESSGDEALVQDAG